jgi:hypothetical protein
MATALATQLVLDALDVALLTRQPQGDPSLRPRLAQLRVLRQAEYARNYRPTCGAFDLLLVNRANSLINSGRKPSPHCDAISGKAKNVFIDRAPCRGSTRPRLTPLAMIKGRHHA